MRAHAYNIDMSAFDQLFEMVGALSRKRYQLAERSFAKLGLNHTEARLLRLLQQQGGDAAQESLSQMIHIDRSNVGRALKRLELEGYMERRKDPIDKRAYFVSITDKGRATVVEIESLGREMAASFFGDLTEEQASQIVAALGRAL